MKIITNLTRVVRLITAALLGVSVGLTVAHQIRHLTECAERDAAREDVAPEVK